MKFAKYSRTPLSKRRAAVAERFSGSIVWRLYKALNIRDRFIVGGLLVIVGVAAIGMLWQSLQPVLHRGGTYTEGIIATSLADVEPSVTALTNAPILIPDVNGNFTGLLADRWDEHDDAKVFDITLKPSVDRSVVLQALDPSITTSPFAGTKVESVDERGIRVTLNQPLASFITAFTKPLVPLGPYIVTNRDKTQVTLVARPNYVLGQPKMETVELEIFPTAQSLQQAVDRHLVNGVSTITGLTMPKDFATYKLELPRTTAAFFNLEKDPLKNVDTRQKLANRSAFEKPLTLTVVTSETLAATADVQALLADWHTANVDVHLSVLSAAQIQEQIIPNRNYDVLIFGIDYGPDHDPYPFWHSSQRGAKGLNLSNFANVDADHLLENARKTGKADDRSKLYTQFGQLLDKQQAWFVIDNAPVTFAVDTSVHGPQNRTGFVATDRFVNINDWTVQ